MTTEGEALYAASGGVATITLNRPARLNAFTGSLFAALNHGLDEAECDDAVSVVVITGAGRAFSAGQDLGEDLPKQPNGALDLRLPLERDYNPLAKRLVAFPKITIAAVNGPAVGAAANLALACDIIVAARSAFFQQAFVNIGLIPDAGGTWLLPRIVGHKRALALALTGDRLSAEAAQQLGLVYHVFADEDFGAEAATFASKLAQGPAVAQRLIKKAFCALPENDFASQLGLEAELQNEASATHDFAEAVEAFKAKRPPVFRGK
jgi:2-(1,2-epoxy-1,2-dihydrophenyl)acetyl-CoA isomerase